jgi:hypothetical protein
MSVHLQRFIFPYIVHSFIHNLQCFRCIETYVLSFKKISELLFTPLTQILSWLGCSEKELWKALFQAQVAGADPTNETSQRLVL